MRERQVDTTESSLRTVPDQPRHNYQAPLAAHLDPLSPWANRGQSGIREQAFALNHGTASHPSRICNSVLQLQRQYGNRYVQRVLALARQGDGEAEVAPEVESAIERARGGGQGLDQGVRRNMESAFGSNFSGVRVHTGHEAHALNRAVNAVAFTTGQDIFFRDGAYSPGSSEGKELLAHELTHVVQQGSPVPISGQAQRFQIHRICAGCEEEKKKHMQGRLTVGQPQDRYEQEADRVAKAVTDAPDAIQRQVDPQPSPQALGTSASPANSQPAAAGPGTTPAPRAGTPTSQGSKASTAQSFPGGTIRFSPKVQCVVTEHIDQNGNKVAGGAGPEVLINDPHQAVALGTVTNEDRGFVRFVIDAEWDFENPGMGLDPAHGKANLESSTPFRVPKDLKDEDDKLKFSTTRFPVVTSDGTGASLDKPPAAFTDVDDRGGSVTVGPSITYQVQLANQLQTGGSVTVLVVSEAVQFAQQAAINVATSASEQYTASLAYKAKDKPTPVPPYDCKQQFRPFVIASDRFMQEDDARQKIHDWYFGLDPHVREDLEQGKGSLRVTGRASTTGSKTFDLGLAEKRAKKVRDIIADFAGSNAHLNTFALGEFQAQTGANTEDPNERRVDVEAKGQVAEMQGDGCPAQLNHAAPTGPATPSENITQPGAPGAALPGSQAAGPRNEEGASSGVAAVSTGNAGATSGSLEEPQSVPDTTGEPAQEQTAQQTGVLEEQQGEQTAA